MLKADKERIVAELTERLRGSDTLIVADYRGLSVSEIDALRIELGQHGARFSVVKNTLTRRAAEAAGADGVLALLDGPTAIAFLEAEGDPVAVARALGAAARETRVLTVRGGILQGRVISAAEVESLGKLPPVDVLRAQLVGALAAPMATVVGVFDAPLRDLVGVIRARIDQLREQGEGAEAQAAAGPDAGEAKQTEEQETREPETQQEGEEP